MPFLTSQYLRLLKTLGRCSRDYLTALQHPRSSSSVRSTAGHNITGTHTQLWYTTLAVNTRHNTCKHCVTMLSWCSINCAYRCQAQGARNQQGKGRCTAGPARGGSRGGSTAAGWDQKPMEHRRNLDSALGCLQLLIQGRPAVLHYSTVLKLGLVFGTVQQYHCSPRHLAGVKTISWGVKAA